LKSGHCEGSSYD